MSMIVGTHKARVKKMVEIGMTMLTIVHGDSLAHFVLHIPTNLDSVSLELLVPRDSILSPREY